MIMMSPSSNLDVGRAQTTVPAARDQTIRKSSSLAHDRRNALRELAPSRVDVVHMGSADEPYDDAHPRGSFHLKRPSQGPQDCAVHRMPPEILGIIFQNCLPENGPIRPLLSEPPLLLGRVCSFWRSLSQSIPRLWTSITFKFLEAYNDHDRSRESFKVSSALHTFLSRSSPLPISISFTDNRIFQKETEEVIIWLLLQIRTNASRWKDIHLQFSSDYFIQLSALSPCKFTALESFSVHTDHMGWRRGLISINLDLTHARNLTSLSYTGPDRVVREDLLVNWSHLTSVSFQYDLHEAGGESSTLPRHFFALALCENLSELSIGLGAAVARHLPTPDTHPHLYLPRLHTLRIRRLSRSTHACALVDTLILPQLTSLIVDSALLVGWDGWNTHWHDAQFSALLRRSGCRLKALLIMDVDFPMEELIRCLDVPGMQGLQRLTFVPCPRAQPIGELIERLSVRRAAHGDDEDIGRARDDARIGHFPELKHIRIGCAHDAYFAPLAEMVESRCGGAAARGGVMPLASFELVFYDFVYANHALREAYLDVFKEQLLRCSEDGKMHVVVRVERPYEPAYISLPPGAERPEARC